jgi:glycosyltransferase involved in cell wall biosynthesis
MIIGIDISTTVYGTGVSNYTLNLVKNLIKIDRLNSYKLFFSSLRLPLPKEIEDLAHFKNVKIYSFRFPPTFLDFLWNRLHLIPIESFIGPCDVFHTSDWTQPPAKNAKLITTVHDLTPFLFPKWHHSKVVLAHRSKMYWAVKQCSQFICVSTNTSNDLQKIFPKLDKNKITVTFEAAEDKYFQFHKLPLVSKQRKIKLIFNQYDLQKFVLVQGTREPRKNLNRLIEAFNLYRHRHPKSKVEMAITGKYGWGEDILHFKNPWIKVLGYIPEKDMVALHASAICLAYPSLYEGFGLPIVKSLAVGVPVLTSHTSSLPEITGKAGILVDPYSVDSIYKGLEKILSSPKYRQTLSLQAISQAANFSWEKTCKKTLYVYQKNW